MRFFNRTPKQQPSRASGTLVVTPMITALAEFAPNVIIREKPGSILILATSQWIPSEGKFYVDVEAGSTDEIELWAAELRKIPLLTDIEVKRLRTS